MPGRIEGLTQTGIIAEMRAEIARLRRGFTAAQEPIWTYDTFTITGPSDTTHTLSWLPYGINAVFLGGVGLHQGLDFTCDMTTGVVTVTATLTASDVLHVRYVTNGDLTAASGPVDTGDISDTFDRANSTSTINPASDGGTWTDERNAWGINGNTAYVHGDSGSGLLWDFSGLVIHRNLGKTAQTVQVDVSRTAGGNNSRIYWSLSTGSPGSAYALIWNVGNDFNLYKSFSNGTGTFLTGPVTSGVSFLGAFHTVKVTYDGAGHIACYVDGASTPFLTYTDGSPLTGTRVGLGQYQADSGTNYRYDNFSAS